MAENLTLYKLIVLYILNITEGPVTASHISDFILGNDYTDYFTLQQSLSELESSGLMLTESTSNSTLLSITAKGKNTLTYFGDRVSQAIRNDVSDYLSKNEITIRQDVSAIAEINRTLDQKFAAHCMLKEDTGTLIDLTLTCKTQEEAEAICANWKKQSFDVYSYLMDQLLK